MKTQTKAKNLGIFALKVLAIMVIAEKVAPVRNLLNKVKGAV